MKKMTHAAVVGAMSAALAACGGGGGGDEGPASGIAGFYAGSMSLTAAEPTPPVVVEPGPAVPAEVAAAEAKADSTADYEGDALALVLNSGEFFLVSNLFGPWGAALQGRLTPAATGSTLSSTNIRMFGEGTEDLSLASASYVSKDNVTATLETEGLDSIHLSLGDFSDTTPTLATLAGIPEWGGNSGRSFSSARPSWSAFTISASGVLSSTSNYQLDSNNDEVLEENCSYSGQVTPVKGGYTLRVSFGTGCHWSGQTVEGWLVLQPDGVGSALRGILLNTDRSKAEIVEFFDRRTS